MFETFFGIFSENNGTFWEKWNILRKNGTFWHFEKNPAIKKMICLRKIRLFSRKILLFLRKFHVFFCILPFSYFSIRPFLCNLDLSRKWNSLRKTREKNPGTGSNQNSGRALCEKLYRSSPPFCAPQQAWKLLRKFCCNFGWDFTYTHKCHWPAKHQHSNQVQSDSLPSVSGDVTRGTQKMLKKGFCKRHLVKWQVASGSLKKVYLSQIFSNVSKKHFFQETCSFWLLGNAKNPTDLKPYWSRACLRHPELATFSVDIRSPVLKPPPLAYFPMFPFCLLLFYIVFMLLPAKSLEFAFGLVSSCSLLIFSSWSLNHWSFSVLCLLSSIFISNSPPKKKKTVKPPDFLDQHKSPYFFPDLKRCYHKII